MHGAQGAKHRSKDLAKNASDILSLKSANLPVSNCVEADLEGITTFGVCSNFLHIGQCTLNEDCLSAVISYHSTALSSTQQHPLSSTQHLPVREALAYKACH